MRGEDRTRYLRYVDGKRGGRKKRKKGKGEKRRLFFARSDGIHECSIMPKAVFRSIWRRLL